MQVTSDEPKIKILIKYSRHCQVSVTIHLNIIFIFIQIGVSWGLLVRLDQNQPTRKKKKPLEQGAFLQAWRSERIEGHMYI